MAIQETLPGAVRSSSASQGHYLPWQGRAYEEAKYGKRILILGDSHYTWREDKPIDAWPDLTRELVQEQIEGGRKRFWTNIALMFLNRMPSPQDKRDFWRSVAFYNFLQSSAGAGANSVPRPGQWKASEAGFYQVLDELRPELMLVLGNRLWDHLPAARRQDAGAIPGHPEMRTCSYVHAGGSCRAVHIRHPGRSFNGRDWHLRLQQVLAS